MPRALRHLTWILALAALGCQQNAPRVGQRTTIQFGTVTAVDTVRLQSDAAAGALIGGTLGLVATGGGRQAPRNMILGAAAGAAVTTVAQGDRTGIAYTVRMLDGSVIRIITNQTEIRVGDCVAIERAGETNNIRREHPSFCASQFQPAVRAVQPDIDAAAARCAAAKEELVNASGAEAVDLATRKVELLCS